MEENAYADKRKQDDRQAHSRVFPWFPPVDGIESQESQEKRKEYILACSKQTATTRQIERNFWKQGKQQ